MDKCFGAAVIGCGNISQMHLLGIEKASYCRLVSTCDKDINLAAAKAKEYGAKYTADYEDVLNDKEVNVVHILTPHYLHVDMAVQAVLAGKHVVLEKPAGIDKESILALYDVYSSHDRAVTEVFQNRYNATSMKAKQIIDSKLLGKFLSCRGSVAWNRKAEYYENSDWKGVLKKEGGGVFISQAIHTIDLVRWLCGDVIRCSGYIDNIASPYTQGEDTGLLTMVHANGGISHIFATNTHGIDSPIELELVFENGQIRFDRNKVYFAADGDYKLLVSDKTKNTAKIYWGMSHIQYIEIFYTSLKNGDRVDIPLEDGMKTDFIVQSLYESNRRT